MKSVLITGAASGIGAAAAQLFHAQGWSVGLLDKNAYRLEDVAKPLTGSWYKVVDVTDAANMGFAIDEFASLHHKRLDLLINSAGILEIGSFEDIEAAHHQKILDINIKGTVFACHAAFAYLKQTPSAQVINLSSASAMYGVPDFASYSASKFAIRGLTEALNIEWRKYDIRVIDVMPSFVDTNMLNEQKSGSPIVTRLGIKLDAEQVAQQLCKTVGSKRVHHAIGFEFAVLYKICQFLPSSIIHRIMAWLHR